MLLNSFQLKNLIFFFLKKKQKKGSTPQWDADPETMNQSLGLHNILFRNLMKEYGGYEVKTEGDAFMMAFADSCQAVQFCIRIQYELLTIDWPEKIYWNPESAIEIDEEFNFII